MVEKNDFNYLLEHHQNFVFFIGKDRRAWNFVFHWNKKKKNYQIKDLVNYRSYKSSITDIANICVNGICLNDIFQYGYIIKEGRNSQIEKDIIKKYVRTDYQERSLFLLSHKTKCQQFAEFFHSELDRFKKEKMFLIENNNYDLIEEKLIRKGLFNKEGYLITGYVAFCDFYSGKIGELFVYLKDYCDMDFGLLFCDKELVVLQADLETDKQRLYWLKSNEC